MFGITTYNSKSINNNHPTIWHGKKSNSRLGRLNFKGFECYWYIYILIYNPFKPSFKAFAPENLQVGKWQTHFQVGWFFWWICVVFCSDFGMFFFVAPIVTSLYEYIWSPSVEIDFGIACPIHLTDKPFASWNSCTAFLDFFFVVPRVANNSSPGNAHSISNPSPGNGAKELSLNFYPKWISGGQRLGGKVCPFFSATPIFWSSWVGWP